MEHHMMNTARFDRSSRVGAILLAWVVALACGCSSSHPKVTVTQQAQPSAPALSVGPQQPVMPLDPPISVASLGEAKAQAEAFLRLLPSNVEAASEKIA